MSSNTAPTSPIAPRAEVQKDKPSLKDLIKKYLGIDHDKNIESSDGPRLEWTHDNKDRFWRKERDLALSLTDSNGLKALDHGTWRAFCVALLSFSDSCN